MKILFLLGCFFIFKNSIAQTQPTILKYPVDSGYTTSFDGTKNYYEVRGSIENTFYHLINSKNES
ncbi:MAG: hypothetical protein KGM16_07800 [Bacteroidota bacterium]|nr:hypothetical protein [Bacteroidota bacterium]